MRIETDAATLASAERAFVLAPAGCGKTELIARAIDLQQGRSLVLTHTHSGVDALRARLRRLGVSTEKFHVATIAGFGLRYASAYPALSGLSASRPTGDEWAQVYQAAIQALRRSVLRDVLDRSFVGVFVDEYQDCNLAQHEIVKAIADVLPCRLLGDPMQGIFDFSEPTVDWQDDVAPHFERLADLTTPHRWLGSNPALGEWLADARTRLTTGVAIDFSDSPVDWRLATHANQIAVCKGVARDSAGSVVAIAKWPGECHDLASHLGGTYGSMEELDCRRLMNFAQELDQTDDGHRWAVAIIDFAKECFTVLGSRLSVFSQQYAAGSMPEARRLTTNKSAVEALNRVASDASVGALIEASRVLERTPGARLYRRELWREMRTTLGTYRSGVHESIAAAAWYVRDRSRHFGRPTEDRSVSRTLLVKGLEFDHAVVTDAENLSPKELYVAMTRGRSSLSVLSAKPTVAKDPATNVLH